MFAMNMDIDEPIVVMDIDILLINNYKELFDYPIERGQFLSIPGWWREIPDEEKERFTINGGFYKYYPKDTKYIFDKFMERPEYYQRKYIEEGFTSGPINGEQHFVEDSVNEQLELVKVPKSWVCRFDARNTIDARKLVNYLNRQYQKLTGHPYMFLNKFHDDIKMVHFTHMSNHPHKWEKYHLFK
jgi:hypothetical protein